MNNKMEMNTYLSTIESEKQTNKKNRDIIMNMENILIVDRWEEVWRIR